MTSRDEALRALEKDLRECARASDRAHMTGSAKDFRDAADRLQAIINESDRQEVAPDFWALERGCSALMGGDVWASFHPDHKAGLRKLLRDALSTGRAASGQEVAPVAGSMVLDVLVAGGYVDPTKLEQARAIVADLSPAHTSEARDAARLDWLAREYVNLMPFDQPTGAGDADVGWRFSRFFQTRPFERVIHTHYNDNLREAIDAAMRQEGGTP